MSKEAFCTELNYMNVVASEVTGTSTVCQTLVQADMRKSRWFTLTKDL